MHNTQIQRDNAADLVFSVIIAWLISYVFYLLSINETEALGFSKNNVVYSISGGVAVVSLWLSYVAIKNLFMIRKINSESFRNKVLAALPGLVGYDPLEVSDFMRQFAPHITTSPIRSENDAIIRYEVKPIQIRSFWIPRKDFSIEILFDLSTQKVTSYRKNGFLL